MKRITIIISMILAILFCTSVGHAEDEMSSELGRINTESADEFLRENGVDISEPETISRISAGSLLSYFAKIFKSSIAGPLKLTVSVLALSLICEVTLSLSTKAGISGEVFTLICFLVVAPFVLSSFREMLSAIESQQAFIASYVPILAGITAASGNISAAVSYNALILYAAQGICAVSTLVLKPILSCMLVLSCTQAINHDIPNLTGSLKRFFTSIIGVVMTVFVGIIGLQTAVGRSSNGIALRTGKYLVSSFVPIIGVSLSESYQAVRLSISAMRSAVGAIGIVVIVIVLCVPIITMNVYRIFMKLTELLCNLTGSSNLAVLMNGIADTYSLCSTVLLIYAAMFIISTGILILLGSEAYI